jgi:hypothetical protein
MAIVQTRRAEPGQISINVTSPGLEPATVTLQAESGPLPPVV